MTSGDETERGRPGQCSRDSVLALLLNSGLFPSPSSTLIAKSRWAVLTCQHAGEEHGWEVVVEVEDPAHQEEGEVMEHPAKQQLTTSSQQDLGQPWAQGAQPQSADREGQRPCTLVQLCPFLAM